MQKTWSIVIEMISPGYYQRTNVVVAYPTDFVYSWLVTGKSSTEPRIRGNLNKKKAVNGSVYRQERFVKSRT